MICKFHSNLLCFLIFNLLAFKPITAQTIYGKDKYIEYSLGKLPIIISVPHGGNLAPNDIPDRTCNNPTTVTDANTIDLAKKIDSVFIVRTGCKPHVILCNLKRTKLDANRNLTNGTCGHPIAVNAWNEFHKFIDTARFIVNQSYPNQAFYFDLHGHGNPIQRVELGYLLYDDELELDDETLNTSQYIENSSIQNLAKVNKNNFSHAQLLRGSFSFGSFLAKRSFPAVPSQSIPRPGINTNYFSGGYNTVNHTCYNPMLDINGVQVECNFQKLRDTPSNRILFALAFVESVIEYMQVHFGLNLSDCNKITNVENHNHRPPIIYPTIVGCNGILNIMNIKNAYKITVYDQAGQLVFQNEDFKDQIQLPEMMVPGIYGLKMEMEGVMYNFRIVVLD